MVTSSARKPNQRHRILREAYRHYTEWGELVAQGTSYTIEYNGLTLSYMDLQNSLKKLSKRKKEAVYYNVIHDMKQKDVADIMGITTVSVGQYVDNAMIQLAKEYFGDEELING